MNEKEYLNHLFDQYVQTQELLELKEEVAINLHESIVDYLKEGLNKKEALRQHRKSRKASFFIELLISSRSIFFS